MTDDYFDRAADFYDVTHGEMEDVEFYVEKAKEVEGRVLEVGCGTGRIYLELLKEGVDAYGIDLSEEMLDVLHEKARERGMEDKPDVYQADMTDFDLDERFELVIIPFRTFLHNLNVEDQLSTLETVREHLDDDGRLILNFFTPDFDYICENYGAEDERDIEKDGEEFTLINYIDFEDEVEQVSRSQRRIYDSEGELVESAEFRLKHVSKSEFELLLRNVGYSDWNVYGGFELDELESPDQEMVWIVEK